MTKFRNMLGIAALLVSGGSHANEFCFYDDELKGILVVQQNTAYAASAYACQVLYDSTQKHYELHEQVIDKWGSRWQPYFQSVENYYKRVYGENWRKQYHEDNEKHASEMAAAIRVNEQYCKVIKTELLLRLKDWERIEASINTLAESPKHDAIRCKE